jgi:hypothetical protein
MRQDTMIWDAMPLLDIWPNFPSNLYGMAGSTESVDPEDDIFISLWVDGPFFNVKKFPALENVGNFVVWNGNQTYWDLWPDTIRPEGPDVGTRTVDYGSNFLAWLKEAPITPLSPGIDTMGTENAVVQGNRNIKTLIRQGYSLIKTRTDTTPYVAESPKIRVTQSPQNADIVQVRILTYYREVLQGGTLSPFQEYSLILDVHSNGSIIGSSYVGGKTNLPGTVLYDSETGFMSSSVKVQSDLFEWGTLFGYSNVGGYGSWYESGVPDDPNVPYWVMEDRICPAPSISGALSDFLATGKPDGAVLTGICRLIEKVSSALPPPVSKQGTVKTAMANIYAAPGITAGNPPVSQKAAGTEVNLYEEADA